MYSTLTSCFLCLQESRPSWLVEHFARGIASFAGRFPLAEANRGKNTRRPELEEECQSLDLVFGNGSEMSNTDYRDIYSRA